MLSAILGRLNDLHDLLADRLPKPSEVTSDVTTPRKIQEPAPGGPPNGTEAVEEPAPDIEAGADPAPPRVGRGGSTEAWADWAARRGVLVEPGQSRNQIIAACQRAGVLTEE